MYGQQIVIETNAAALVQESSGELARWLGQITGAPFGITNAVATNLTNAIYLLSANSARVVPADRARLKDQGPEAFVIRSEGDALALDHWQFPFGDPTQRLSVPSTSSVAAGFSPMTIGPSFPRSNPSP